MRPASAQRSRWRRMETQRGRGAALAGARAETGAARSPTRALPRAAGPAQWWRFAAGEHPPRVALLGSPGAGEGRISAAIRAEAITQTLKHLGS